MLQGGEIIIIALIALIVLGPRRLPELARKAGEWMTELRKAAREITEGLEAEVSDFKEVGQELRKPLDDLQRDVRSADPRKYEWTGPKPVSGPTPDEAMADLEKMEKEKSEESDEGAE